MDKIRDIICNWIAMKGIFKITKLICALIFLMLLAHFGFVGKFLAFLCLIGFIKCLF